MNSTLSDADPNIFCKIFDIQSVSLVSDEKSSPPDNHPVFAEPSTGSTGGSNPLPRTIENALRVDFDFRL